MAERKQGIWMCMSQGASVSSTQAKEIIFQKITKFAVKILGLRSMCLGSTHTGPFTYSGLRQALNTYCLRLPSSNGHLVEWKLALTRKASVTGNCCSYRYIWTINIFYFLWNVDRTIWLPHTVITPYLVVPAYEELGPSPPVWQECSRSWREWVPVQC